MKKTNAKILNAIILISLAGIILISVKDSLGDEDRFPPPPLPPQARPLSVSDPEIPCVNKYFNFKKGTTWQYRMSTVMEASGQRQTSTDVLTNTISEASTSSVIITTQFNKQKESTKTRLVCKKNGVYGFPFPLTSNIDLTSFLQSVRLIPPYPQLEKGTSWQDNITVGETLQDISLPFTIPLMANHRVVTVNKQSAVIIADLVVNDKTLEVFNDLTDDVVTYTLAEGKGLVNLSIDIHLENAVRFQTQMQLVDFRTL